MKRNTTKEKENNAPVTNSEKKWIPLRERKSISIFRIFAICSNQIALSFIWVPLSVLTAPMCKKLGLSHFSTSLVMLIGPLTGLIVPPIVSALSDSTTLKMGPRRIYIILGEILVIIGLPMIGFCREISTHFNPLSFILPEPKEGEITDTNKEATFYFVIGELLALVGGNMANGPGRAMCTEVVPPSQKVLASSIIALDNALAALISNSIGAFKLYCYTNFSNETFVMIVSCVIGIAAITFSVISTPEEQLKVKPKSCNPITVLIDSVCSIDKNMFFILCSNFFYGFGYSQFYAQGANYIAGHKFGGVPNAPDGIFDAGISYYQFLMLFLTCSQLVCSSINTKLIKRIGFKWAWSIAMIFQATSDILLFIIKSKKYLFIPYILCGFTSVMNNSVPLSYVSLNAPPEQSAGYITLLILTNNISAMLANVFLHMFLGSMPFFMEDQGRLIALGSIFCIISFFTCRIGYGTKAKAKKDKTE